MMVQLGQVVEIWEHARDNYSGGAGTQTAGLGFWWLYNRRSSNAQKNMMVQLGHQEEV
jgi:hypothetical protein